VEQERGKQSQISNDIFSLKAEIKDLRILVTNHEKARTILRLVGEQTQKQLEFHISDITTLALESVFPDPYTLEVEFIERRGKTECDLYFSRDGERVSPLEASGGGAVDVAAFALRVASWSMVQPRYQNTIILDEPLRFLSEEYQEQASKMIKEVSDKLKIQFIIVTHEPVLAAWADKEFQNTIKDKVSYIHVK